MNADTLTNEITKKLAQLKGAQFISLTYLSKKAGELARHTLILGFSYNTLVRKSVLELELLMLENANVWTDLQKQAANELLESFNKTLAAHEVGQQNEDYTKKGMYLPIANGVNLNLNDKTIQLFGMAHAKVVLVEGVYPKVNSRPLTIAKDEIRKQLSISRITERTLSRWKRTSHRLFE